MQTLEVLKFCGANKNVELSVKHISWSVNKKRTAVNIILSDLLFPVKTVIFKNHLISILVPGFFSETIESNTFLAKKRIYIYKGPALFVNAVFCIIVHFLFFFPFEFFSEQSNFVHCSLNFFKERSRFTKQFVWNYLFINKNNAHLYVLPASAKQKTTEDKIKTAEKVTCSQKHNLQWCLEMLLSYKIEIIVLIFYCKICTKKQDKDIISFYWSSICFLLYTD